MRKTKLEKCAAKIRDDFSDLIDDAFQKKFERELDTFWNVISMQLVSVPTDEQPLTTEQHAWIGAFSDGYAAAMNIADEQAQGG